jgi:hypothetical protein
MKKTLYLLRKPIEQINPALFHPSDSQGDIVLLEQAHGAEFPYTGGSIFSLSDPQTDHGLTYDGLVEKIFECDHTVVI